MAKGKIISGPVSENQSIRIKKIENGYLVCRDQMTKTGYSQTETFSPTKPVITIGSPKAKGQSPGPNKLSSVIGKQIKGLDK